jgi:hypothetical protein
VSDTIEKIILALVVIVLIVEFVNAGTINAGISKVQQTVEKAGAKIDSLASNANTINVTPTPNGTALSSH